ncbi:glycosyltransferase family 9 protein [Pirellulaceae bacterium SH501]
MRIAVVLPNWVGDTCMATPALRAIAELPSLQELILVGKPGPLSVLEGLSYADNQIVYKPRSKSKDCLSRRGAAAALRRRRVDAIVLLPNSLSTGMMAWLSRIPERIGFAKNGRGFLLTKPIAIRLRSAAGANIDWSCRPAIDYYLHLAEQLGAKTSNKRMELAVRECDRLAAHQLLNQVGFNLSRKLIVVNNASGSSPARLLPEEHVVRFARRLAEDGNQVLFHAGPADRNKSIAYARAARHTLVRSMGETESLPIGLTRGLISAADLLVTTDSGPRHIGVALGKRVMTLFGPTVVDLTRTYNVPELIMETSQTCRPCGKDICPLKHQKCLQELGSDRLYDEAQRALHASASSDRSSSATAAA